MIKYRQLRSWMRRHDEYKYELLETYAYGTGITGFVGGNDYVWLAANGLLTMQAGYQWDGASGPAIDTKSFMRGSLVHDALYQLIRDGVLPLDTRAAADFTLHRLVIEDGMWRVRAAWVLAAVRVFGQIFLARG